MASPSRAALPLIVTVITAFVLLGYPQLAGHRGALSTWLGAGGGVAGEPAKSPLAAAPQVDPRPPPAPSSSASPVPLAADAPHATAAPAANHTKHGDEEDEDDDAADYADEEPPEQTHPEKERPENAKHHGGRHHEAGAKKKSTIRPPIGSPIPKPILIGEPPPPEVELHGTWITHDHVESNPKTEPFGTYPVPKLDLTVRGTCTYDPSATWPKVEPASEAPLKVTVSIIAAGTQLSDAFPRSKYSCEGSGADRRCRYSNLCANTKDRSFVWNNMEVASPTAGSMPGLAAGTQEDLSMRFADTTSKKADRDLKVIRLTGVTGLIARRIAPWNAGHLIMQTSVALERLANEHGVCSPDRRVVLFTDSCVEKQKGKLGLRTSRCRIFTPLFAGALSAYPLLTAAHFQLGAPLQLAGQDLAQADYVCFDDALAGIRRQDPALGGYTTQMSQWVAPWREKLFLQRGFQPPTRRVGGCNVLFTWKEGFHGLHAISNPMEVDAYLRAWTSRHGGQFWSYVLGDTSFAEQLATFQHANIQVAVAGSTAFSSFQLGEGSDLVYLSKSFERGTLSRSAEVRFSFLARKGRAADLKVLAEIMDKLAELRQCPTT